MDCGLLRGSPFLLVAIANYLSTAGLERSNRMYF